MGKYCLRRSCRQRLSPAVEAAAYLTLRSGRRVPAGAGSGSGSPRRRHPGRRGERCCGKATTASAVRQAHGRRVIASQACEEEAELPPSQDTTSVVFCNEGCGGDRRVEPHSGGAKRDHHESDAAVEPWSASSPPDEEIEAFLAAAELAERRRFIETYNYDIALDRPLEGRFDWSPVVSA